MVAVGGNALIRDAQHTSLDDQYDAVCATATHVVDMIAAGWNVVLTHGNGPQVGFILRRSEIATGKVPTVPIRYAVADTQGAIGFMFQNAMVNALKRRGIDKQVVTLVTQTVVDVGDPAFARPDKPVGSFMSEEAARELAAELGWTVMQDGNRGWRRVVASPQPVRVIEAPIIERLAREGVMIIALGGGGIAVEELPNGELRGVEAVIDKDRAAALLAIEMRAELLMIPTGVERVAIRFGAPDQLWLDTLDRRRGRALRRRRAFRRRQHGSEDRSDPALRQGAPRRPRRDHQRREHRAGARGRDRHLDQRLKGIRRWKRHCSR